MLTYNLDTIDTIPGDIDRACISVGTDGWSANFGTWEQNAPTLRGFDNSLDAWAFIVATTGIDPQAGIPDRLKQWTKRHPAPKATEQPADQPSCAQFSLFGG